MGANTLSSAMLTLFRSGGFNLSGAVYSAPSVGDQRVTFTPSSTAVYLLDISGTGTGGYTLVSSPADEFSSLPSTTTTLAIGGTQTGALQTPDDADAFAVTLVAGYAYQFDALGQGTSAGTLASPTLTLTNSAGNNVAGLSYATPTLGDRRVNFTPNTSAVYVLTVSGSATGTYSLVSAPQDDFSNSISTTAVLSPGGLQTGALQTVSDTDLFAVNLVAGVTYQFDALGAGAGGGTLSGQTLAVYSNSGNNIGGVKYSTPVAGDSRASYTAATTATYFVSVSGTGTGTYTLVTPSANATLNNTDGTSYRFVYTPTATVLKTISQYSGANAAGAVVSTVVNNYDGSTLIYAYNLSSSVSQTTTKFSGTNTSDGSPTGSKLSVVVNNSDKTTLVYAYNPSSTVQQTTNKYSGTDPTSGAPIGSQISAVVNNNDGTTLVYAYNPLSGVKQTTSTYTGTDPSNGAPTGSQVSTVINNTDNTTLVYAYNVSTTITQTVSVWSGTNTASGAPSGQQTALYINYTSGRSAITTNPGLASAQMTYYSGLDGTGSMVSGSGLPSAVAASATAASIDRATFASIGPNEVLDPGFGNHNIQFLLGATNSTLVLHDGGVDQVTGFDPMSDVLDLRAMLAAAHIMLGVGVPSVAGYVTVSDQGTDAVVQFDVSGNSHGSTVAVLHSLGQTVTGIDGLLLRFA